MIQPEKTYRKETIPGLRSRVDRAVEKANPRKEILQKYQSLTNEEVYDLCPFRSFLDTFPGLSDWTALSDFGKELDKRMKEEVGAWAKNTIEHLEKDLNPKQGSPYLRD